MQDSEYRGLHQQTSYMNRFILLLALLLSPLCLSAQRDAFEIDEGKVSWKRVYETQAEPEAVSRNLLETGYFHDVNTIDGMVTAELRGLRMDYKGAGYKRMSLPLYIVNNTYSGFVTVQFREGRYRVSVSRVKCFNSHYGESDLETFALDKTRAAFDKKFLEAPAAIISYTFDSLLSKLDKNDNDDEW